MVVHIDPAQAPLRNVPDALKERRLEELAAELEARGIVIVGGDDTTVILNLRNLPAANGDVQRGQQMLLATLEETLHATRIDLEVSDIEYLWNRLEARAIARGLQAGIPGLVRILTRLEPSELFTALDQASAFIHSDKLTDDDSEDGQWLAAQLRMGAEADLRADGLLDGLPDNSSWLDAPADPMLVGLDEYARSREDAKPFRSSFDLDQL